MAQTVVGLYDSFKHAQEVVRALVESGIPREDISVLANRESTGLTGNETFHEGTDYPPVEDAAGKGATTGSLLGGLTGFLVGMGFLAIPGVGPLLAAGPLLATLTGAGIGAAAGGVIGALTKAGVPQEHAEYYAEGLRRGGVLVLVHANDSQAASVATLLNRFHPIDIETRGQYYRETGYTGPSESLAPYTSEQIAAEQTRFAPTTTAPAVPVANTATVAEGTVIPVVEESLQVGKRSVETGGARVHTRVIETPVQESVTLHEEHVTVDRHTVNRAATAADLSEAFTDGTIEVRERAEVPVVAKEARVVEEVNIGKEAADRTHTVSDTVRRTDVEVEELTKELSTDETVSETTRTTGVAR